MPKRFNCLVFVAFSAIFWLAANATLGQTSTAEFHRILREKNAFTESDFVALEQGQTVVRLLPVNNKREVAVYGLMSLQVPADLFLQSFRETMVQKSNPAILEIGRFSSTPTLEDLQTLTFEDRDLEDLKECVVGECQLKLSVAMIERLGKEVDWDAPEYRFQATQLLKAMLLDYVRDYLKRGDAALIEYHDKREAVRLAEEQGALMGGPSYINSLLPEFRQLLSGPTKPEVSEVENAIVWSKIKFGLKPVIAFNHITIFKRPKKSGPQILIASKQIYANHYFDSSLALTAFVNIPGANPGSYLIYENRSRADGLEGAFSKLKRGIVEERAVSGLKAILDGSRASLNAHVLGRTEYSSPPHAGRNWKRWTVRGGQLLLLLLLVTGLVALYALGNYNWRGGFNRGAQQ